MNDEANQSTPEATASGEATEAGAGSEKAQDVASGVSPELERARVQLEQALRRAAELDNMRKRVVRDRERELADQQVSLLRGLLPVVDNVERAVTSLQQAVDPEAVKLGMKQILQIFTDYLGKCGVKPIPAVGEPYDPNLHEAIAKLPSSDFEEGHVSAETERGYFLNERVLRHSRVVVSSGKAAPVGGDEAGEASE
jgi:molecular chaperone GrpE